MNRHSGHTPHPQSGFSLVEILVALVLGLVLLGGTIAIYASSKDSYRLQENIAAMQENARYAVLALRDSLEMAGFPSINNVQPFLVGPEDTRDGDGNSSDQITIRYESRAPLTVDCLGSAVLPEGSIIENHFFITEQNSLACRGNGNNAPQELVENVDNLQIQYGVDSDGDGAANLYVSATEVEAGIINAGTPDWERIVSLRLALLVASDSNTDSPAQEFTLLDAPTITKDDGRMYRVFTATIPLRNRIP